MTPKIFFYLRNLKEEKTMAIVGFPDLGKHVPNMQEAAGLILSPTTRGKEKV